MPRICTLLLMMVLLLLLLLGRVAASGTENVVEETQCGPSIIEPRLDEAQTMHDAVPHSWPSFALLCYSEGIVCVRFY